MSTRETSAGAHSQSLAPRYGSTRDNLPQSFETWCSAALEPQVSPPLTHGSWSATLAGSPGPFIRAPLERGEIAQALIDVCAVTAAFLFALLTALGIVFAIFVLLFVKL